MNENTAPDQGNEQLDTPDPRQQAFEDYGTHQVKIEVECKTARLGLVVWGPGGVEEATPIAPRTTYVRDLTLEHRFTIMALECDDYELARKSAAKTDAEGAAA